MSYKAYILFQNNIDTPIELAFVLIKNSFKGDDRDVSIEKIEKKIVVKIDDWTANIYLNSDASVLQESKELAENFASNTIEKSEIEKCSKRLEIVCEEDIEMDYFNDYLTILQELKSLPKAKVWEQAQQEFI